MTDGESTVFEWAISAARGDADAADALKARLAGRENPFVVAVDFDGTLCRSDYPDIGEAYPERIAALKYLRKAGARVILWTCREADDLTRALEWLSAQGLAFDAVNDNTEEIKALFDWNSRKVYADEYWDDKSVRAR